MATFVYKCPTTGLNVQGWAADQGRDSDNATHQPVTCLACRRVHLVNPKTRKVLGSDDQ